MQTMNQYAKKDAELFDAVRRLQAGDGSGTNQVYELSEKYIYKIINDIVKNHQTTEDLMQETYMQVYNKIDSLQSPEAFYVWAGRIATNLTLRYIQKYRKEVLAVADEEGNTDFIFETAGEDTEEFLPETVLDNKETQRLIADIIDNLSIEQKLSIQYFYYEEMSVRDIAAVMGCSEGTVKSRLNYARKSIKNAVIDLDVKQGVRLYSLASMPVFLLLFRAGVEQLVIGAGMAAAGAAGVGTAQAMGGSVGAAGAGTAQAMGGSVGAAGTGTAQAMGGSVGAAGTGTAQAMGGSVGAASAGTGATATGAGTTGAAATAGTGTAGSTGAAAGKAAGIGAKIFGTTTGKAAVGVLAAAVVATGGAAALNHNHNAEPGSKQTGNKVQVEFLNDYYDYSEYPATERYRTVEIIGTDFDYEEKGGADYIRLEKEAYPAEFLELFSSKENEAKAWWEEHKEECVDSYCRYLETTGGEGSYTGIYRPSFSGEGEEKLDEDVTDWFPEEVEFSTDERNYVIHVESATIHCATGYEEAEFLKDKFGYYKTVTNAQSGNAVYVYTNGYCFNISGYLTEKADITDSYYAYDQWHTEEGHVEGEYINQSNAEGSEQGTAEGGSEDSEWYILVEHPYYEFLIVGDTLYAKWCDGSGCFNTLHSPFSSYSLEDGKLIEVDTGHDKGIYAAIPIQNGEVILNGDTYRLVEHGKSHSGLGLYHFEAVSDIPENHFNYENLEIYDPESFSIDRYTGMLDSAFDGTEISDVYPYAEENLYACWSTLGDQPILSPREETENTDTATEN